MNKINRIFLLSGLFVAATAIANPSPSTATHEYTLKNGLKVIVKENHRAPTMISQIWYKVGSAYEPAGLSGISHALEHMMFKGTPSHPAGSFSKLVAENGGQENAFTAYDYTAYFQKLPADKYALSFSLEADRMQHLKLNAQEFKKEIEVIKEERRMRLEDNPQSLTYEKLLSKAQAGQPYQHMTIGSTKDLSNLSVQDLQKWYQEWYAPNNAILVVVGDVDPQEIFAAANRYFGKIPSKKTPVRPSAKETKHGFQEVTIQQPAQLPYLLLGFNTPSTLTAIQAWQPYALEVISGILDAGNSSRLSKNVIRGSELASSIQTNYDLYSLYSGLFILGGIPAKNHSMEELKTALLKQVEDLKTTPVSQSELERVKTQIKAHKIFQKDSIFGTAMAIGSLESVGLSWHDDDAYSQRTSAITPQQVQQAAQLFFTNDRLTVAQLQPQTLAGDKHAQ